MFKIPHRFYITLAALVILATGMVLGGYLVTTLEESDFEAAKIGLSLATITILLIMGSFILQIKETLESKKGKK
tara:strand:+ start:1171 stop:1392 length:222 start_codon:yes stop_codon:yes gene_type:complete